MNPYADRIVPDPETRPSVSVQSYNKEHLDTAVSRVLHGIKERRNSMQATVLISANPGSGKTHLLSRLIEAVAPAALPIFIPPIHDRIGLARGVVSRVVSRLWRMDDAGRPVNQFKWLVLQLLALACGPNAEVAGQWRTYPVECVATPDFQDYLRNSREELERFLCDSLPEMTGNALSEPGLAWAKALLDILSDQRPVETQAIEWIKGRLNTYPGLLLAEFSNDEEGMAADPADEVTRAENRLYDIERLFGLCRPLVFIFDQVENFSAFGPAALQSFVVMVERLLVQCPATQVVIAANGADWNEFLLSGGLPEGYRDRFHSPLVLRGLFEQEARELRDLRAGAEHLETARHRIPDSWIRESLHIGPDGRPGHEVVPRRFLEQCAQRWDGDVHGVSPFMRPDSRRVDVATELAKTVAMAEREAFGFYPEMIVTYLIEVLGGRREAAENYEFVRLDEWVIFIEPGANWSRWDAWARRVVRLAASPALIRALRPSKDLCAREHLAFAPVPGSRWSKSHSLLRLLDEGMRVEYLDSAAMLDILGACRLLDAAGDLGLGRTEVAQLVARKARDRWRAFFSEPSKGNDQAE